MKIDPAEKNKFKLALRTLLSLLGLGLLVWGLTGKWGEIQTTLNPEKDKPKSVSILKKSSEELWQTLKNPDADANQRGNALLQLTKRKEDTQSFIDEFKTSENDSLRRWAVVSLTVDYDKHKEILWKFLDDPNRSIRKVVYNSLQRDRSEEAKKTLMELNSDFKYFKPDRPLIYKALYAKLDEKEKEKTLKGIIKNTKVDDFSVARDATIALAQIAPDHKLVKRAYRDLVTNSKHPKLKVLSLSYLSNQEDSYLLENFNIMLNDNVEEVRKAALKALPQFCPKQRWKWLAARIVKESDEKMMWEIIHTATRLDEQGAINFLQSLKKIESFTPGFQHRLDKYLKENDLTKMKYLCN